jgi:putative membrane protein
MWHSGDGMGWWMVFGSVWMVFFWALIIWALVRLFSRGETADGSHRESPLDIVRRRYAGGEISREEFEQLQKDLGEG